MNSAERLHRLFDYDSWACLKIVVALDENDQFELRDDAVAMLAHIVSAQVHWYTRITGEVLMDMDLWPETDLDECRKHLIALKERWTALIDENAEQLDRPIEYKNSKGGAYTTMLSDILHHVIIHGQHHRAQIASMLRRSGMVPPPTDFIFYLRDTNN